MYIDTTAPDRELRPGVDLWRVKKSAPSKTTKGDPSIVLELARVSDEGDILRDTICLAGGGWPIGKRKLGAFLPTGFKGDVDPLDFVDRKLWVETGVESYVRKDGKPGQSLKVLINGLKHGGYQPEADVPPGHAAPSPIQDAVEQAFGADTTPF